MVELNIVIIEKSVLSKSINVLYLKMFTFLYIYKDGIAHEH